MRFAFVRCAYLRRRALRCVDRVEVLLHPLNLAIVNDEEEMILILISLAALHLLVSFRLDCDPVALGGDAFGREPRPPSMLLAKPPTNSRIAPWFWHPKAQNCPLPTR
jgi:hypothetical protein